MLPLEAGQIGTAEAPLLGAELVAKTVEVGADPIPPLMDAKEL
jgi:hypothetical protein